jgi:hypothetical protein
VKKWLIIGGNKTPHLIGKVGTQCNAAVAQRVSGAMCVLRQLSEYHSLNGNPLFFLPEHLMLLPEDPAEQAPVKNELIFYF